MKRSVLYFLFCVVFSSHCFSQEAGFAPVKNIEDLKTRIESAHKNTSTVKSQFTQEKHLSFMQDKVTSKGIFMLKKQGKMRIEYTSPFAYLVVINGDKLYVKDGKKTTKIDTNADKSFRQLNEVLSHSLNGDIASIKGFQATYLQSKEYYLVELVPTETGIKDLFTKIKLYLDPSSYQVAKLDLLEKSGDITKMRFEQTQTNVAIPDDSFVVR